MIHEVSEFKACRRGSGKRRVGLRILLLSQLLCGLKPQMETLQQHHSPASPTPTYQRRHVTPLQDHPGTLTFLRSNFLEPLKQSAVDFTSSAGNKRSGHPGTFSLASQTATTPHVFVSREPFSIPLDNCKDNFWMLKRHLLLCCDT